MQRRSTFKQKPCPQKDQRRAFANRMAKKLDRMLKKAESSDDVITTEWEGEFMSNVQDCLTKYGRAFADPEKGDVSMAVSIKQSYKIHEITRMMNVRAKKKTAQTP